MPLIPISDRIFQVTSAQFGAYDPDFTKDKSGLLFSEYCSDGLMVSKAKTDTSGWGPRKQGTETIPLKLYDILAKQEGVNLQDTFAREGLFRMLFEHPGTSDSAGIHIRSIHQKIFKGSTSVQCSFLGARFIQRFKPDIASRRYGLSQNLLSVQHSQAPDMTGIITIKPGNSS